MNMTFNNSQPYIPVANGSRIDCAEYDLNHTAERNVLTSGLSYFWTPIINDNSTLGDCWTLATVLDIDAEVGADPVILTFLSS